MQNNESPAPLWMGLISLMAGLGILGIAFGVVPVDPDTVHAPLWVVGASGVVFLLAGVAVLARDHPHIQSAAGGTLVLTFGIIGAWVAFWGSSDGFSGGVPFLSPEANVLIARLLFGFGAVLCFALFVWGTRQIKRGGETSRTD